MSYRNLLVPVDPAGCAFDVVAHANRIATAFGARVHLLHVLHPPSGVHLDDRHGDRTVRAVLQDESHHDLDQLAAAFSPGVEVERIQAEGDVTQAIVTARDRVGADLVVMGTHGRTGLRRVLMGSVAEQVLRHATVPCLIVHAPPGMSDRMSTAAAEVQGDLDG